MAFVSDYDCDVFISYAHVDNDPYGAGRKRWVDAFHGDLLVGVSRHLGTRPVFWRDPKLAGTDQFPSEIETKVATTALFLAIFSPGYLKSEWCRREYETFVNGANGDRGLRVGNQLRLIKVVKTQVEREQLPVPVESALGYEFYRLDQKTGRPKEFSVTPDGEQDYWDRIEELSQDVARLLTKLQEGLSVKSPRGVVYLAEGTSDVRDAWQSLRWELLDQGYGVLPDCLLPRDSEPLANAVNGFLGRADLYVQLLGDRYGESLEADARSIPALQFELLTSHPHPIRGFVWNAAGPEVHDERQRDLLESVADVRSGHIELLRCPMDRLKQIVLSSLANIPQGKRPGQTLHDPEVHHVYVVCDPQDQSRLVKLRDYLLDLGIEPLIPRFNLGSAELARRQHHDYLKMCDAVLVYWGAGDDEWLRAKLDDIRKAAYYRKHSTPLRVKTVFVTDPIVTEKERFRTLDAEVVKHYGELSPDVLSPFVARLKVT